MHVSSGIKRSIIMAWEFVCDKALCIIRGLTTNKFQVKTDKHLNSAAAEISQFRWMNTIFTDVLLRQWGQGSYEEKKFNRAGQTLQQTAKVLVSFW